jgi:hypothetical protein
VPETPALLDRAVAPAVKFACAGRHEEIAMHFVVVPKGRSRKFGFWLRAESAEEARRLVSLNVPEMGSVTNPDAAECSPDETYAPMHGVIVEGFGRSYTITRRNGQAQAGPLLSSPQGLPGNG